MTPDAALDNFAFFVGLRLMGVDARRRLRIALLRHPETITPPHGAVERLERLDTMLDGGMPPATLQDRLDIARAELERSKAPFDAAFWLARVADLITAGFTPQQAARLVQEVRNRVDPASGATSPAMEDTA